MFTLLAAAVVESLALTSILFLGISTTQFSAPNYVSVYFLGFHSIHIPKTAPTLSF